MLQPTDIETIKEMVEEFFRKMTVAAQIEVSTQGEQTVFIRLKTDEPQILIGENGQTLIETQQLLKTILRKKIPNPFFIDLDINDYKKGKGDYLRKMAQTVANEVVVTKQEKWLPIMPAYERRIIHIELAGRTDVIVESRGEEPTRRIVVRPSLPEQETGNQLKT